MCVVVLEEAKLNLQADERVILSGCLLWIINIYVIVVEKK